MITKVLPRDLKPGMQITRIDQDLLSQWITVRDVQAAATPNRYRIDLDGGVRFYVNSRTFIDIKPQE